MKISEAKAAITAIVKFNIAEYEASTSKKSINAFRQYIVPMLESSPGIGKTAAPRQVAAELEIPYFQTIVAQYDAGEMAGLPMRGIREYPVHDDMGEAVLEGGKPKMRSVERMIRLRPSYLPDIDDPEQFVGIYNLDELPQAFQANQNICSQLVNEWRIGEHRLSPAITIVATGNRTEDKAGTQPMPAHLKDRLMFLPIESDHNEFLVYSAERGLDPRVRTYIRQNPSKLNNFDPKAKASPTPRSWEKVSQILALDIPKSVRITMLQGQVGPVATEFEAWLRVENEMPDIDALLKDPKNAPLFDAKKADVLYLLLSNLSEIATIKNLPAMIEYVTRLPNKEFMMMWAREIMLRHKELKDSKPMVDWKMKHATNMLT